MQNGNLRIPESMVFHLEHKAPISLGKFWDKASEANKSQMCDVQWYVQFRAYGLTSCLPHTPAAYKVCNINVQMVGFGKESA